MIINENMPQIGEKNSIFLATWDSWMGKKKYTKIEFYTNK